MSVDTAPAVQLESQRALDPGAELLPGLARLAAARRG